MQIKGTVKNIIFRSDDTGFTVLELVDDQGDEITAVGPMLAAAVGERIEVTGDWNEHRSYGMQFKATGCVTLAPATIGALTAYLSCGRIKGIGPETAKNIVATFGMDTISVMENQPERLTEVYGIGRIRAAAIAASYMAQKDMRDVMIGLQEYGITVNQAMKLYKIYGPRCLERLKENPDTKVALLDIMLPGIDGFEVCRRIRATNTKIGIIMLTARSQEMDKVTGLMTGADDYVTKPFSPAELTARVDALFRRAGGEEPVSSGEIRQPPFLLNTRNRTLEKDGQRIKLTQVEYSIMKVFMENPGKALSREEILDMVWGRDYFGELKIVDVNIRRLRLKIEDNVQNPTYITTVWGYGYKWGF